MIHKEVWESLLLYSSRNIRPVDVHLDATYPERYVAFQDKYQDAQDIPASEYPKYIYFESYDLPRKKKEGLPDIFTGAMAIIFVSEAMRDLLEQFELGRTRFHEVPLFEYDQKTPYPGRRWFMMHILENRKTFVPELSTGLRALGTEGKAWQGTPEGKNKLAVNPAAASDLDMWLDRRIRRRVFFSDRLKTAIKDSGLSARWMGFRPCLVTTD